MRKLLTLLLLLVATSAAAQKTFTNPIISGYNPDPSITRAGEYYYVVTSTNEYLPAVPVYRSRDLVNWEMIGHVLDRPSQINLDNVPCSGGIYAPTIRYHKGVFYVITTLSGGGGNFVCTATDPAGPWSDPHWIKDAPGIDPSLFFDDDGKVYYCGNLSPRVMRFDKHRDIWIQEFDIERFELVGPRVDVLGGSQFYNTSTPINGSIATGVNNYESPHIYKKNGLYYMIIAHGGTSENHAVSIWNADNIFGPYRICPSNPILTHRDLSHSFPITSTGHADLVEAEDGSWWGVYLAKRPIGGAYIVGREVFLSPIDWSAEWPVFNPDGYVGRGEVTLPLPKFATKQDGKYRFQDNFDSGTLRPEWTFIRIPRTQWWNFSDKKGQLTINLRPEQISLQSQPSFIGIRQMHYNFNAITAMEFTPAGFGEEAGFVIERDNKNYIKFIVENRNNATVLSLVKNEGELGEEVVATIPSPKSKIYLRIECRGYHYSFHYSYDNKTWKTITKDFDGRLLSSDGPGRFTGAFIGLYASSNGAKSTNSAYFDWMDYFN